MKWTLCQIPYMQIAISIRAVYGVGVHLICMSSTHEQMDVITIRAVYGVGVKLPAHSYEAPHNKKLWGYPYVENPIANNYEVDSIITIRAVYGVNLTAYSYEAAHSKTRWVYPYVEYPIANTYEVDPMTDSHSCKRSVWSEPYGTQL